MRKMSLSSGESQGLELYSVRNKDTTLGTFEWVDDELALLKEDSELPSFISRDITAWLESRTPSKHRTHIEKLLLQCGLSTTKGIIDFSKGLALTDTLWVSPSNDRTTWSQVSLFRNRFDETIARIAFDGGMYGLPFSTTSPEFSTDGMLAKCWVRDHKGGISLYKAGTEGYSNTGMEPYSEVMAHQILTVLEYPHVPYTLARFHGKLVSVCPLFTSESIMLLPLYKWYSFVGINDLLSQCSKEGIGDALAQHLIYDYLSWNTDRHAGNIGVLLNADTFKLQGMAPIYDNGASLLAYWNGSDNLCEYTANSTPALYNSFEVGAKLGKRILGGQHNVQRLIGFKFNRTFLGGYPTDRLRKVETWIQGRVKAFLAM